MDEQVVMNSSFENMDVLYGVIEKDSGRWAPCIRFADHLGEEFKGKMLVANFSFEKPGDAEDFMEHFISALKCAKQIRAN